MAEERNTDEEHLRDESSTQFVKQSVELESAMDTDSDEDEDISVEDKHKDEITRRRAQELARILRSQKSTEEETGES